MSRDMRPVVALSAYRETARWGVWERPVDLLPAKYADAVWRAGGAPLIVPALPGAAAEVLGSVDALLVAGGSDLDPGAYGAVPHPLLGEVRPDRDATELDLVREALASGAPVLGVCRGAQVLNVALGGSLHQHLPEVTGVDHRGGTGVYTPTDVRADARQPAGRGARGACGGLLLSPPGPRPARGGTLPVGIAPDGAIEAVELPGAAWVVGVQWHPEEGEDPRLFEALVEQARSAARAGDRRVGDRGPCAANCLPPYGLLTDLYRGRRPPAPRSTRCPIRRRSRRPPQQGTATPPGSTSSATPRS